MHWFGLVSSVVRPERSDGILRLLDPKMVLLAISTFHPVSLLALIVWGTLDVQTGGLIDLNTLCPVQLLLRQVNRKAYPVVAHSVAQK